MIGMMVKVKDVKTRSDLEKIIADQQTRLNELEHNVKDWEKESETQKKALEDALATSTEFESMVEEFATENKQLQDQLSHYKLENDELRRAVGAENGKPESNEYALNEALQALQQLTEKLREEKQKCAGLEKEVLRLKHLSNKHKLSASNQDVFKKITDILCEELVLLDDDILLTGTYNTQITKEDPYMSNLGRPKKQRSPFPSMPIPEDTLEDAIQISPDRDLSSSPYTRTSAAGVVTTSATGSMREAMSGMDGGYVPTRTPLMKKEPLRQLGQFHHQHQPHSGGEGEDVTEPLLHGRHPLGGVLNSPLLEEPLNEDSGDLDV